MVVAGSTLSKRLKKKIQDVSGLSYLKRKEKSERAREILDSNSERQRICKEVAGLSSDELVEYLESIADSPAPISEPEEREKRPIKTVLLMDRSEINKLIHASESPLVKPSTAAKVEELYPYTYSESEVKKLVE